MPSQHDILLRLTASATHDPTSTILSTLHSTPSLVRAADAHGYTLLHAAASYNRLTLMRALVQSFDRAHAAHVDVRDADGDSPLFFAETVECARCLVRELGADVALVGGGGDTVVARLEGAVERARRGEEPLEDWVPAVLEYLRMVVAWREGREGEKKGEDGEGEALILIGNGGGGGGGEEEVLHGAAVIPQGVRVEVGTMNEEEVGEADPEIRQRIEELSQRPDFQSEQGQAELRNLVQEIVGGMRDDHDRNTRRQKVEE